MKKNIDQIKTSFPEHDGWDFYRCMCKMAVNHYGYQPDHIRNRLDNYIQNKDYRLLPFWIVEKLLEWNFDIGFDYSQFKQK